MTPLPRMFESESPSCSHRPFRAPDLPGDWCHQCGRILGDPLLPFTIKVDDESYEGDFKLFRDGIQVGSNSYRPAPGETELLVIFVFREPGKTGQLALAEIPVLKALNDLRHKGGSR